MKVYIDLLLAIDMFIYTSISCVSLLNIMICFYLEKLIVYILEI